MAAQSGVATFRGRSGKSYSLSLYFDDTPGNPVRMSRAGKAAAGSFTDWAPPEPAALIDFCLAAATTQTTTQITSNGEPYGDILLNAQHLVTVTNRPPLAVVYTPLNKFGAIQLA